MRHDPAAQPAHPKEAMADETKRGRKRKDPLGIAVLLAALVALLYTVLFVEHVKNLADAGTLGDAFGPFAGLVSAAALVMALRSVQLQQRALAAQRSELKLQRKELKLQRQEMRDARSEMVAQRKQLERSANAQQALADAQLRVVRAQHRANLLLLKSTAVQVNAALLPMPGDDTTLSMLFYDQSRELLEQTRAALPGLMTDELELERETAGLIQANKSPAKGERHDAS